MKKNWTKPVANVEEFAANEYVTACYYIGCDYAGQNIWVNGHYQRHDPDGCGNKENQAITVHAGNIRKDYGATISITELNTRWGDLTCYFVPQEHAQSPRTETISGVSIGDEIYWVTDVGYWMTHKGTVQITDVNHPQHS